MTRINEDGLSPLGRVMEDRREQLGLTWRRAAAASGGVAVETFRAVRYGDNDPTSPTQRGIERALQWKEGSVAQFVRDGTLPAPLDGSEIREPDRAAAAKVLFPDDQVAQAIVNQTGKDPEVINRELADWLSADRSQRALRPRGNEHGTITQNG